MLLLFLFVLLLFVVIVGLFFLFLMFVLFCFVFLFFFRDSNMISTGIAEFRYYVVIIILMNLGKPEAIRVLGS